MSITAFKCPCCGAELTFSSQAQKMSCEYCGTELDVDAVAALAEGENATDNLEWESHNDTMIEDADGMCTYTCNSCGAEISGDRTLGATTCPYCDSPFVMNDKFAGMLKPDYVIPFKIDKDKAVEQFKAFCKSRPLLPTNFLSSHRIESLQGTYVPYWLFDCKTNSVIHYKAERLTTWNEGDTTVTKTDHFRLIRGGTLNFNDVPVDATTKLENNITEAVEPFNMEEAVDYNSAYLSGYLADKYDVNDDEAMVRANERIKESVKSQFRRTTATYTSVIEESSNINLADAKINYALLPMWIMTAKYNGKLFTFAMNGQTGRFVGQLPISWGKFFLMLLGIAAAGSAVIALILSLIGI